MVNQVHLRQEDQFQVLQEILQRLTSSDNNLFLSCSNGESLFTSKRFLGVYSKVIRNICMEYPNDEVVTLLIPFSKSEVLKLMDFLGAGELTSVTQEDMDVINELLICLGITVGDTTILREESTANTKSNENKKVRPNLTLDVSQSSLKNQRCHVDKLNISKIVKISPIAQETKIDKTNILNVLESNNSNIFLKVPSKPNKDGKYNEKNQGDGPSISLKSKISDSTSNKIKSVDFEVLNLLNLEEIKCSECPEIFTSNNQYNQHWKLSHIFECKDINCEKFGKLFNSKRNYRRHKQRHQNNLNSVKEALYQKLSIPDKEDSRPILENMNRQCKVAGCKMFGKAFKTRKYYGKHMKIIHNTRLKDTEERLQKRLTKMCKILDCPNFGEIFHSWKKYQNHLKSKKHMQACSDNSDQVSNKCPKCDKVCKSRHKLEIHMIDHTKDKVLTFECKECGKLFGTKSILQNHQGVHNPIKCDHCEKTFAQKAGLIYHIKSVHDIR